jgi:formyltetrahydrofolate deformylase
MGNLVGRRLRHRWEPVTMHNLHEWADPTDVAEIDVQALPLPPAIPAPAPPWRHATLLVACPDQKGVVAEITQLLHAYGANIIGSAQHTDPLATMFFQRLRLDLSGGANRGELDSAIRELCERLGMSYRLHGDRKRRVAILCSKQEHCLYDLLVRYRAGELPCDLAMIISNHVDAAPIAKHFAIPFHHMPVTADTKAHQESTVIDLLHQAGIELVVLARYMQILSARFVEQFRYRIINIHHSFLPAFVGANPYRQAYEKGVKLIGATSHYVTADLDQGPIIEQETIRVSHRDTPEELQRKGKDLEKRVLASALRWHLEDRILIHQNKTVVFD